jgi:hypothetical protein
VLQRTPVVAGVVGLATLVAGIAAVATATQPWIVALVGLVPLVGTGAAARVRLHRSQRLAGVRSWQKTCAAWLVTLATVLHVAWVTAWSWSPSWGWWLVPGLAVLAWAECGVTLLTRRTLLRPRTTAELAASQQRDQQRQQGELSPHVAKFRRALDEGDWGYVQILGDVDRRGPHTSVFHVMVPARATARMLQEEASGDGKRTLMPFNETSGPALAGALSQVTRHKLREKWVTVESTGYAGYYDVTVMTRDVMADVHPYVDDLTPITLDTPCNLGVQPNGAPALLPLRGHGLIVASSQVGKTNLLYVITSHLARAGVVIWVAGRRKQYETWAQYLLKYLDTRHKSVIDWLVNGQYGSLELLLATYLLAQDRQATPFDERDDWPPLFVILDEASDVLIDTSVVIEYQGQMLTASDLLAMCMRGIKGSLMYVVLLLHKFVNGQLGHQGTLIRSGFDWCIVLRSGDRDDAMRVLGTRLPELEHPGELYFRVGNGAVTRAKAWYVQEIGKPTAPQTGGVTVPEVGWARRSMARALDQRGAAAAGQHYADRHQYVTSEFMAYLQVGDDERADQASPAIRTRTTTAAAPQTGDGKPRSIEDKAYRDYLAKLEAAAGLRPPAEQQDAAPAAPTARKKYVRRDAVLQLFDELGPMDSGQLIDELRRRGDEVTNPIAVYNLLNKLANTEKLIEQLPDKRYTRAQSAAA